MDGGTSNQFPYHLNKAFQQDYSIQGSPRKVPGQDRTGQDRTGQDRTGSRDLECSVVPWSCGPGTKEVQKSQDVYFLTFLAKMTLKSQKINKRSRLLFVLAKSGDFAMIFLILT